MIKALTVEADKTDGVCSDMSDRRDKPRITVCLDATWDGARGYRNARVTDLSESGCYVDSINSTVPGEILRFKVQLPDGEWLDLVGEVAHSFAQVGFGIRFLDLDESQLIKLHLLVEHLLKSSQPQDAILISS